MASSKFNAFTTDSTDIEQVAKEFCEYSDALITSLENTTETILSETSYGEDVLYTIGKNLLLRTKLFSTDELAQLSSIQLNKIIEHYEFRIFKLLKKVGGYNKESELVKVIINLPLNKTITITLSDISDSIKAVKLRSGQDVLTIRGYSKALSLKFKTFIEQDVRALSSVETQEIGVIKLNFEGGSLVRKFGSKATSPVTRYFLTDTIDHSLIPDSIYQETNKLYTEAIEKSDRQRQSARRR
jgi:hypothetical protein